MNARPALTALLFCLVAACAGAKERFAYSGTLQADAPSVGSTVGGRVVAVLSADGQHVAANQILVRLDDRQERAAFDAASAQASQALAALNDLKAGPRQAEINRAAGQSVQAEAAYRRAQLAEPSQIAAAEQAVREARANARSARSAAQNAVRDFHRFAQLYANGAISAQEMESTRTTARTAQSAAVAADARLHAAQAQRDAVLSGTAGQDVTAASGAASAAKASLDLLRAGARPDQIAQARAALAAALANVAAARARLDETIVRSPAAGIVDALNLHRGDLIAPGAAVATIDEFGDPWVRIYVAQADLGKIKIGDSVDARSDAFGDRTFAGRIEAIDSSAQFTPRDVQTASDRADLTFGVKVRIHDPGYLLRTGTTVEVALP